MVRVIAVGKYVKGSLVYFKYINEELAKYA